jgi:hypothetical protein
MVASLAPSVSSTDATVQRYVYLEPGYQIYIDDYSLAAPAGNFTIDFKMGSVFYLYSVRALGPDNQSLSISGNWSSTDNSFTVIVQAGELTSFRVITILHGTTIYSSNSTTLISNYSTPVNFFPSVNASLSATTTVRLPYGAELLAFNETGISSSVIDGMTVLSGSIQTTPSSHYYSNVTYNGTFDLLAIQSLDRTFEVYATGVHVSESFKFMNVGNVKSESVTLALPAGATSLRAYDLIGNLPMTFGTNNVTIASTQGYSPASSPSSHLSTTCRSPLSRLAATRSPSRQPAARLVQLPRPPGEPLGRDAGGQLERSGAGRAVNTSDGRLVASFSNMSLTLSFNHDYSLSFSYSPVSSIGWGVILVVIIVIAAAAYLAYRIFRRPKGAPAAESVPAQAPPPARQPPPPQKPSKGRPGKK